MEKPKFVEALIDNMLKTIDSLHGELQATLATARELEKSQNAHAIFFNAFLMGIDYICIGLAVSASAALKAENLHAKRFHWKNVVAGISEGYKYIYFFGDKNKPNPICAFKDILDNCEQDVDLQKTELMVTLSLVEEFGQNQIFKELRDIAMHYDKSSEYVLNLTSNIDDEDALAKNFSSFLLILLRLHELCNAAFGIVCPKEWLFLHLNSREHKVSAKHLIAIKELKKDNKFTSTIRSFLDKFSGYSDDNYSAFCKIHKVCNILKIKDIEDDSTTHFGKLYQLLNIYSLIIISMVDLLSITDSYMSSRSEIEAAINMKYFLIVKTSVLKQLYGVVDEKSKVSLWNDVKKLIPDEAYELQEKIKVLEEAIIAATNSSSDNNKVRAKFVHVRYKKTIPCNVKEIFDLLDAYDPLIELYEVVDLVNLLNRIVYFLVHVLSFLNERIQEENRQHIEDFSSMFSGLRKMVSEKIGDGKPQKEKLYNSIDNMEQKFMSLLEIKGK